MITHDLQQKATPLLTDKTHLWARLCAVALLTCLVVVGLAGCASDADAAKNAVSDSLSQFAPKEENEEALQNLINNEQFLTLGVDVSALVKTWLTDYKFEVGDASVSEDGMSATVQAKVTSKQLLSALDAWGIDYTSYASQAAYDGTSAADIAHTAGQMLMTRCDELEPVESEISVSLVKQAFEKGTDNPVDMPAEDERNSVDVRWVLDSPGQAAILTAVLGAADYLDEAGAQE